MCNTPPRPHSLQQGKLGFEEGNRQREAAAKKNAILEVIKSMRNDFQCLVREVVGILTSEELKIDRFITEDLETKGRDMLADGRLEMACIEEKNDRLLGKPYRVESIVAK